jgi:hypothetical protein
MQKEFNLFGTIREGKLEIQNKEKLLIWAKGQPEGSSIVVKFKNQDNYYSHRQLRLLYFEFRKIAEHLGYSVEDVKTIMKMKNGFCYSHALEGQEVTTCRSISDFNRKELSKFIMDINIWANQNLGLELLTYEDLNFLNK